MVAKHRSAITPHEAASRWRWAISLSDRINLNSGLLRVSNAGFLGSNTVVNNAGPVAVNGLWFDNTASGTYSGNMTGTGVVYVGFGGAGVTTFSGNNNSFAGDTYVENGTLAVTGGNALSDTGGVFLATGGVLNVQSTETIGSLNDGVVYPGTGIVTRKLRDALPDGAQLTATDFNPPIIIFTREAIASSEISIPFGNLSVRMISSATCVI